VSRSRRIGEGVISLEVLVTACSGSPKEQRSAKPWAAPGIGAIGDDPPSRMMGEFPRGSSDSVLGHYLSREKPPVAYGPMPLASFPLMSAPIED
jgi:hypothetical protein